jgi:hypothetical protein
VSHYQLRVRTPSPTVVMGRAGGRCLGQLRVLGDAVNTVGSTGTAHTAASSARISDSDKGWSGSGWPPSRTANRGRMSCCS